MREREGGEEESEKERGGTEAVARGGGGTGGGEAQRESILCESRSARLPAFLLSFSFLSSFHSTLCYRAPFCLPESVTISMQSG